MTLAGPLQRSELPKKPLTTVRGRLIFLSATSGVTPTADAAASQTSSSAILIPNEPYLLPVRAKPLSGGQGLSQNRNLLAGVVVCSLSTHCRVEELAVTKRAFVLLLAFLLPVIGCGHRRANELFEKGMAAAADSSSFALAEEHFSTLLSLHPDYPRNDEVLFTLAQMAQARDRHRQAVAGYQKLADDFPQSRRAYQAQFMVGFLYEVVLQDTANAKIAYQKVIDHYPDSDLADDAQLCIKHIGQSPEEWITFESASPGKTVTSE